MDLEHHWKNIINDIVLCIIVPIDSKCVLERCEKSLECLVNSIKCSSTGTAQWAPPLERAGFGDQSERKIEFDINYPSHWLKFENLRGNFLLRERTNAIKSPNIQI